MSDGGRIFGPAAAKATGKHWELAIHLLRAHRDDGRLTEHELGDRAHDVIQCRTLGELDQLFNDLPVPAGPQAVARSVVDETVRGLLEQTPAEEAQARLSMLRRRYESP